jgi:uncharacterized protein YaaQ
MKMIILILKDHLTDALTAALTGAHYRVTRIASTGGFLHSGVATLLIGVEDAQIETAISLIRTNVPPIPAGETQATLFVIPVSRFEQV